MYLFCLRFSEPLVSVAGPLVPCINSEKILKIFWVLIKSIKILKILKQQKIKPKESKRILFKCWKWDRNRTNRTNGTKQKYWNWLKKVEILNRLQLFKRKLKMYLVVTILGWYSNWFVFTSKNRFFFYSNKWWIPFKYVFLKLV